MGSGLSKQEKQQVKIIFDKIDRGGKGKISLEDLKVAFLLLLLCSWVAMCVPKCHNKINKVPSVFVRKKQRGAWLIFLPPPPKVYCGQWTREGLMLLLEESRANENGE